MFGLFDGVFLVPLFLLLVVALQSTTGSVTAKPSRSAA
jgi:hypothetical protein